MRLSNARDLSPAWRSHHDAVQVWRITSRIPDADRVGSRMELHLPLIAHLMDKDNPVRTHRFAPHIILRSNLPLFVGRLAAAPAAD